MSFSRLARLTLLLVLTRLALTHAQDVSAEVELSCPRSESRVVRKLLDAHVTPLVRAAGVKVDERCPLNTAGDRYLVQQDSKKRIRATKWRCMLCNKLFRSEDWLDMHLGRKHGSQVSEDQACLADACDFLDCSRARSRADGAPKTRELACRPDEMLKRHDRCIKTVHKCFPPAKGPEYHQLHDKVSHMLCDPLHCSRSREHLQPEEKITASTVLWWIAAVFIGSGMLVWYAFVAWRQHESSLHSDLKKRSASRAASRLRFWESNKKASKGDKIF